MAYERAYDLFDLAILMQSNREGVSLQDICERFGVARRTAERMRDTILIQFPQTVETVGEKNSKRWHIPQGTLKDFIQFSAEELSSLEIAVETLKNQNLLEKAQCLEKVLNKVRANIKDSTLRKIEPDLEVILEVEEFAHKVGPQIEVDQNVLRAIREAILSFKQIEIEYEAKFSGKIHTYTLNPYGILYGDRNHYLLAVHSDGYDNGTVRNFILSNIKTINILEELYEIPSDFNIKEYASRSFGIFQEEPFDVEWLFSATVAKEVKRYLFHPTQKMIENSDGTITVKFHAGGRLEMDWHLYTWGDNVKVIKPTDWYDKKENKK